ncbi:inositol monophosphatase family protein [Enterococcus sp. MMGLQ5-2]|nr:inositol monophosphatase family protein [Enterococcus sp. MMGLQ5-2]MBS7584642.1 inositol monophosphatase family protein [Enterococcus sp. MMGLQ5-1]NPD12497.1 inositol monophosphatase family protein [Enterococcus sp. MMGLQ5-1]NPD37099.1 inositol monophosphatase family protein [Enterococcus sp. MMGLQ5-2]
MESWLREVREKILAWLDEDFTIEEKTGRSDLVTAVDKAVQDFLVAKINTHFPEDAILAEENGMDKTSIVSGAVWVIDPIDGTLNFAVQHDNFAILVAYYLDGTGQFGFVYDVMKNKLFSGGKAFGAKLNGKLIEPVKKRTFSEGLIGINAGMYRRNSHQVADLADQTLGVRVNGSAGLEFCALFEGKLLGYVSRLCPWDYAAGTIIAEQLGFSYSDLDGQPLDYQSWQPFIIFQSSLYPEAITILNSN